MSVLFSLLKTHDSLIVRWILWAFTVDEARIMQMARIYLTVARIMYMSVLKIKAGAKRRLSCLIIRSALFFYRSNFKVRLRTRYRAFF